MDLAEFVASLPSSITGGRTAVLPDKVIRKLLALAEVQSGDTFYHLQCGEGRAVELAATEFRASESVGIEPDPSLARIASNRCKRLDTVKIINDNLLNVDLSRASVVLLWYGETAAALKMERKIKKELQDGGRVITIWSPFGLTMPDKIEFPFFVTIKPFRRARSIRDQIKAIYGNSCIDFTAAWLLAERYIDQLGTVKTEHRRFVNILQSLVIWINAWKMGVTCENEVPPPVDTYIGIMKTFFGVDLSSFLEQR